jgi:hypothetical protein
MADLLFGKFLPMTVPPTVKDSIHTGNMTVYMEYMISASMAAGTGGNSSLLPSNGTCVVRKTASFYSHEMTKLTFILATAWAVNI